jgi:hypothetical protein
MRFAYIDSHGNEVPIPSVDALGLRIELGAVGPDTQLYDAQADHWGPAKTHEIFHTLAREVDAEGFVAPPPVAPPPPAPSRAPAPDKPAKPKLKKPERKKADAPGAADLGLTLAAAPPPPETEAEKGGGSSDLDLDLALPSTGAPRPSAQKPKDPPQPAAGGEFEFGDLAGGLELEGLAPSSDAEIESAMDFGGGGGASGGGDLLLETPMSEFQPGSPPGWMDEPAEDAVMDFSAVSAEAPLGEDAIVPPGAPPGDDRRTAKDRPSAPKFKRRRRSLSGPIVMIVVLLAVGVGGYVGWPILSARLSRPETPARPAVVMPAISAEMLTRMQALVDQAIGDVVRATDAATSPTDAPPEPPQEWLAGVYLGNASRYPTIETFWTGMGQFVDRLRAGDSRAYRDALGARVEAEGLAPEDAAIIMERADSGFVAAEVGRLQVYDAMERLVVASLDLHDFLVLNEANIEYRPALASTADPVLEAVPSIPAVGDRMWDMVDAITEGLDALGSLDRVTRARLTAAVLTRLQDVGIQ